MDLLRGRPTVLTTIRIPDQPDPISVAQWRSFMKEDIEATSARPVAQHIVTNPPVGRVLTPQGQISLFFLLMLYGCAISSITYPFPTLKPTAQSQSARTASSLAIDHDLPWGSGPALARPWPGPGQSILAVFPGSGTHGRLDIITSPWPGTSHPVEGVFGRMRVIPNGNCKTSAERRHNSHRPLNLSHSRGRCHMRRVLGGNPITEAWPSLWSFSRARCCS